MRRVAAVPARHAPTEPGRELGPAPRAAPAPGHAPRPAPGTRAQVQGAHAAARQRLAAVRARRDLLKSLARLTAIPSFGLGEKLICSRFSKKHPPFFKKGDELDANNYKSIAVILVLCKTVELVINSKLL